MKEHEATSGTAWINSDLAGEVTSDKTFRLQDDFHAAVNHDWLATAQIRPGEASMSAFRERMDEVQKQIEVILKDTSDSGHVASLVHGFYNAFLDMDARNKTGIAPVMSFIERIEKISTMDELSDYLASDAYLSTSTLSEAEVFADKKDSLRNVVYLDHDSLSLVDANEYRDRTPQGERTKTADDTYFAAMLQKVGFSQEASCDLVKSAFELESQIGTICLGADAQARDDFEEITYNPMTLAQLQQASPTFPLDRILAAQGLDASRKFVLGEPDWLARMNSLYTDENLEGFKALLLIRTLTGFAPFLDHDCYELSETWRNEVMGSSGSTPLEKKAYDMTGALLDMAVGRLYTDRFLSDKTKTDVEGLITQVIETYRSRLMGADWLSSATRDKAVEKLDNMTVRVGRPTSWPHYENLRFDDADTLVDRIIRISAFEQKRQAAKVNQEVDREEWAMAPQAVNAYYMPTDNSINILAGILGGAFYDEKGGPEARMGGIGMVIGHEITHAFDKTGSLYDKNGNLGKSWWTDADRAAFKQRTDKVTEYWNGIEVLPGRNIDGALTVGENTADLGGMTCMASIGRDIPGFDWKLFFSVYARDWRTVESPELAEFLLVNDVHAPGHLRTNAVVQQLPEFYTAFDVKPGDGMYLSPEQRLQVW